MPSLEELKTKWFLKFTPTGPGDQFPPIARHPGTALSSSTDGNRITTLIDGARVMADFYDRVSAMMTTSDPAECELWIASWRIEPVKLKGVTKPEADAQALILAAAAAGVRVRYMGSGHVLFDTAAEFFANEVCGAADFSAGISDKRFPVRGSQHQKFNVFRYPVVDTNEQHQEWSAVLGSVDLSYTRWDTSEHKADNPDRPPEGGPTHDVSVLVEGPAVRDIALTFSERWNDKKNRATRTFPALPVADTWDVSVPAVIPTISDGDHSVQVLRTYAIEPERGYSWSSAGEFTVWASYLNAIKQAKNYIYIEDQYFYTFEDFEGDRSGVDVPDDIASCELPRESNPALTFRDSDIVFQLGKALECGVHVVVLVPSRSEDTGARRQLYQRKKAAAFLRHKSRSNPANPNAGRFVFCNLKVGDAEPVIHSKLMIVDDEFVLIGSANVCQRSMAHDSEIHLGIIDGANLFAKQLRIELWKEHMDLDTTERIDDPRLGVEALQNDASAGAGRLVFSTLELDPKGRPCLHSAIWKIVEPYIEPKRK